MNYILHINPTKLYDHYMGKLNTPIIKNTKTQNPEWIRKYTRGFMLNIKFQYRKRYVLLQQEQRYEEQAAIAIEFQYRKR